MRRSLSLSNWLRSQPRRRSSGRLSHPQPAETFEDRKLLSGVSATVANAATTTTPLVTTSVQFLNTNNQPITQVAVGQEFLIQVSVNHTAANVTNQGVLSAYLDVHFDTTALDILSQQHHFDMLQTGTIDEAQGLVDEAGGIALSVPTTSGPQRLITLRAIARNAGATTVSTSAGENLASQIVPIEPIQDVRDRTQFGSATLTVNSATLGQPTIGKATFSGNALQVEYQVSGGTAAAFDVVVQTQHGSTQTPCGTFRITDPSMLTSGSHALSITLGTRTGQLVLAGSLNADGLTYFTTQIGGTDATVRATGGAVDENGQLMVFGTDNADVITQSGTDVLLRSGSHEQRLSLIGVQRLWIQTFGGNDVVTLHQLSLPTVVLSGAGADAVSTGSGNDFLDGGDGADSLQSGAGNDVVGGNAGDDVLTGGLGDDMLSGGDGTDRLEESSLGNLTLTGAWMEGLGDDDLWTLEAAILRGGPSSQLFDASGFTGPVTLSGDAGNDSLMGTAFNDEINGDLGADRIDAGAGNDTIHGGLGSDVIQAGTGNDRVFGEGGYDTLTGGLGDDTIDGGGGNDVLVESGNVNFTLSSSQLTGNGTDRLRLLEKAVLTGGASANKIIAKSFKGSLGVVLDGGAGNDTLVGGKVGSTLLGGDGNDSLTGLAGNDALYGEAGNDLVADGAGNDTVDLGAGDDTLTLGAGNDRVAGGLGTDLMTRDSTVPTTADSISGVENQEAQLTRQVAVTEQGITGWRRNRNTGALEAIYGPITRYVSETYWGTTPFVGSTSSGSIRGTGGSAGTTSDTTTPAAIRGAASPIATAISGSIRGTGSSTGTSTTGVIRGTGSSTGTTTSPTSGAIRGSGSSTGTATSGTSSGSSSSSSGTTSRSQSHLNDYIGLDRSSLDQYFMTQFHDQTNEFDWAQG